MLASFKLIEDAEEKSRNAEKKARAATTDDGSAVEQSQTLREEIEDIIEEKKIEFDDKLQQVWT